LPVKDIGHEDLRMVLQIFARLGVEVFETMSCWILQDETSPVPQKGVYMVSKTKSAMTDRRP